jgi:DNA-binding NtrC family response regulator
MARILILDDELDAVQLLQKILKMKGYEVFGFTEEEEAIAFASSNRMDLSILDLLLKKVTGIEVLAELKRLNPQMRAIMLTGYPTLETAEDAARLGADDYCVKPIDIDELERKVERALSKTED